MRGGGGGDIRDEQDRGDCILGNVDAKNSCIRRARFVPSKFSPTN